MHRRTYLTITAGGLFTLAGCEGDGEAQIDADVGGGGTTEAPDGATSDQSDATAGDGQSASIQVGEVAEGANLSMVVTGVERTTQIGDFQEADEGNEYVIVGLAVKNTTQDEFLNFSGFLQTQLRDAEDYTYEQTIAVTDNTFEGGQLAPGEVSRGDVVYEVPQEATGLRLEFDFQAFSFTEFERVSVDLSNEADEIASLEQTLAVDVHDLGQSVTHEDVTVTANSVEFVASLGQFAEAEEGMEFAIVDITTENGTEEEQHISTLLQMPVKDGEGNSYDLSITAQSSLDQPYNESQPLAAGETRRGKVAYEVPQDASPLYWIFEFTLWTDGDKTFWGLR